MESMRLNLGLGPSSAFRWPALPLGGAEPRAVYHIQKCAHARCVFTMCWSCSINLACMYQIIARTEAFSTWHSGSRYSIHLCLGSTSFAYNGCMQKKGIYIYIYVWIQVESCRKQKCFAHLINYSLIFHAGFLDAGFHHVSPEDSQHFSRFMSPLRGDFLASLPSVGSIPTSSSWTRTVRPVCHVPHVEVGSLW